MIDDTIKVQNEFHCLQFRLRANQTNEFTGISEKPYIQVHKTKQYGSLSAAWTAWVDCVASGMLSWFSCPDSGFGLVADLLHPLWPLLLRPTLQPESSFPNANLVTVVAPHFRVSSFLL